MNHTLPWQYRQRAVALPTITWFDVREHKPTCSRNPDLPGVEVLIWPNNLTQFGMQADVGATAFYGRRHTGNRATFYKYGAEIINVTHWAYLPEGPLVVVAP